MDTDSRDTIIRELREENASLMARVQSLGDREAELRRHLADPRLNIDNIPWVVMALQPCSPTALCPLLSSPQGVSVL